MIDFNFENNATPQKGSLLISEPFLSDTYFSRSVVLLCDDHPEEGSFGFVLNKYVDIDLGELIEDFPSLSMKISIGGPVDTSNLFFIHRLGDSIPNSAKVSDGIYFGGDFQLLKEILEADPTKIDSVRFFIGYSGWSKGQLDDEINEKSWLVVNDYPVNAVFDTSDVAIWKHLMEKQGTKFKVMSNFPKNPSDN